MGDGSALQERFLQLFIRLARLGWGSFLVHDTPLTPSQIILLDWIAQWPGCGIREIAQGLGLTPPSISVAVRRLERSGWVERRSNPRDGRAIRILLSRAGCQVRERVQIFRQQKARQLLSGLASTERIVLLDLLERALRAAEEGSSQPAAREDERR